jgi:hypothetical protein
MWRYFQVWTLVLAILLPGFSRPVLAQASQPTAQPGSQTTPAARTQLLTISNRDMNLMRQDSSTANLRAVYARYKPTLRRSLPAWGLDDDGLALIFATLVAYQAAPYGNEDGPVGTLRDMFAQGYMECRGYALFVAMLFHQLQVGNRWQVYLHGFDKARFIGNHAQVFAVDSTSGEVGSTQKRGMVLDAMVGVVARVVLDSLPLAAPAADVLVLGSRKDTDVATVPELRRFREGVIKGLTTPGTYVYAKMIYQEDTSVFLGVGTSNPNLRTLIGVNGRSLYVMPATSAETPPGPWQQLYTYTGYNLPPPYNPAVAPYQACTAPAPGRPAVCACFSHKAVTAPSANGRCLKS